MKGLEYWTLCDHVTVVQAALLIAGADPAGVQEYVDSWPSEKRPLGYDAAKAALVGAITSEQLPARKSFDPDSLWPNFELDWLATTIEVSALRVWLESKGIAHGFFFAATRSPTTTGLDYLSPQHRNYAPKLAAAVEAWKAVSSDPRLQQAKSIKRALTTWLRAHAREFQLVGPDGKLNELGIEEVAKVANWETKGGSPKTPQRPPTP